MKLPEGWDLKKLEEVCFIQPPKKEARSKLDSSDVVSFLPMQDLGIQKKYTTSTQAKSLGEVIKGYTYFANDDVLLAKITPCFENGKLGIAKHLSNGVGFGSSEYIVFRVIHQTIDNEYLYYFLSTSRFKAEGSRRMLGTAGQKRLSKDFIKNYSIPLPPLEVQRRIVLRSCTKKN